MSILLDALKKSESQRQLGKTPTIHSTVEASEADGGMDRQWIALSMLALSAVAIAWFGWQQYKKPVDTLADAGVDVVAAPQVAETQVPAAEVEQTDQNRTRPASLWNMKNDLTGKKDLSGLTILPANSPEEARQRREKTNQSFKSYETEKDTSTDLEAESSAATVASTSADRATAQSATRQSRGTEKTTAATPTRRLSRPERHEPEPISFWQIPQALRDGLPEFRINVLVYAENPEDRFLLINGLRLVERDELTDGVVLDEIRRDGAVFTYRKYRFLVKG